MNIQNMQIIGPEDQQKLESLVPKSTHWAIVHNSRSQRYFDLYQKNVGKFIFFKINDEPFCGYKDKTSPEGWTFYDKEDYRVTINKLSEMAETTPDELRRTMESFF
jgi:hypothetical protein